jgi:hypothetical protein
LGRIAMPDGKKRVHARFIPSAAHLGKRLIAHAVFDPTL